MESKLREIIHHLLKEYASVTVTVLPDPLEFDLNISKDNTHGDFATNVAFKLARHARAKPQEIAANLVRLFEGAERNSRERFIDRMEVAGGGFINFYLKKASLAEILLEIHRADKDYGKSDYGRNCPVLLEFVSANPTGPLTIAHGRQAAIGDSLARILNATGHKAAKEFYLNDAGRQMGLLGQSLWVRYQEQFKRKVEIPEDGYHGDYLKTLSHTLVQMKGEALLKGELAEAVSFCQGYAKTEILEQIKDDLKTFGVQFDSFFHESALYEKDAVKKTLAFLKDKNQLYEQGGALWFRSTSYGDDKDRVVQKSTGEFTYLAPDIAYHHDKFERGFRRLVNFWGPDHHGYVVRLKAACEALGHRQEEITIRIVQLTTLFRKGEPVKMSTRAGEFVTLKELMDEVGVDAARFFFIMRRVESPLDFDLDLAKQKSQENPVYYLQYAHARAVSILKFANRQVTNQVDLTRIESQEALDLVKALGEFPKCLIQAAEMLEPYRVTEYLRELAMAFHKFYQHHRVVTEDEALTQALLLLVDSVRIVIRNGLEVLGISQPESM